MIIGKTNLPEHSADVQTYNRSYGQTRNPMNVDMTSGGSSGGSAAAVCAGLTGLEFGTDIAGSIRIPSSFVGVCGHKPTNGLISMSGCTPNFNHPSFESNVELQTRFDPLMPRLACAGPIARRCEDLELAMKILPSHRSDLRLESSSTWCVTLSESRTKSISDLRVATWFHDDFCDVDSRCVKVLEHAALSLVSAGVSTVAKPEIPLKMSHKAFWTLLNAEIGQTKGLKYATFSFAQKRRNVLRNLWISYFRDNNVDAVLLPVFPRTAFPHDTETKIEERKLSVNGEDMDYWSSSIKWAGLASLAGLPATSVSIGQVDGLPVGVQIVSAPYNDLQCIEVGKMFERIGFGYVPPSGFD